MQFSIEVGAHAVDENESLIKDYVTGDFSEAIGHYLSAVQHFKGEIMWGTKYHMAFVKFQVNGKTTEVTSLKLTDRGIEVYAV